MLLVLAPTTEAATATLAPAAVVHLRPGIRLTLGRAPSTPNGKREFALVFSQLSVSTRHCELDVSEVR